MFDINNYDYKVDLIKKTLEGMSNLLTLWWDVVYRTYPQNLYDQVTHRDKLQNFS